MMKKRLILIFSLCLLWAGICSSQHDNELVIQGDLYLQPGSELFVGGDFHIENNEGLVSNNGLIKIEGHLIKDGLSLYDATQTGSVKIQNDQTNVGEIQFIEGDFTGANAFFNLEINNSAQLPLVYQKSGNVEVTNSLTLTNGVIRTSNFNDGPIHDLHVSNPAPDAINGNLQDNFISGNLVRSIQPFASYFIPVGTDDQAMYGPQPFQLTFRNGPSDDLTIRYDNWTTTQIPSTAPFCDNDQVTQYFPGGVATMDCAVGQWVINASASNFDYDIELFPSPELMANCGFLFNWLAKDGQATSNCPVDDIAAFGLTEFSTFDIPGFSGPILPIELTEFEAIAGETAIELTWKTHTEVNFDGYGIEKSTDAENFEQIAWVEGKGDANLEAQYTYVDNAVQRNTIYYYRLKQTDLDGKYSFSPVRTAVIGNPNQLSEARVFPNPITPKDQALNYFALANGQTTLSLYNSVGQLVFQKTPTISIGLNTINLPNLPTGIYQLVIQDEIYSRRGNLLIND